MKTKLTLQNLKVDSFVTSIEKNKIDTLKVKGGTTYTCGVLGSLATIASMILISAAATAVFGCLEEPKKDESPVDKNGNTVDKNGVQGYTLCCSHIEGCDASLSPGCLG